jgi:hypothetical protein
MPVVIMTMVVLHSEGNLKGPRRLHHHDDAIMTMMDRRRPGQCHSEPGPHRDWQATPS